MCGIAGALTFSPDFDEKSLVAMSDSLTYRGPDSSGTWFDPAHGAWLAHRRLSILDLSPAGRQPMLSGDGRFVLTFNGEIYNHPSLRKLLADRGVTFRGHSDTETILESFAHLGFEETLDRISGMFALALWDRERNLLRLVRDRTGMKPLFYWRHGANLFFGSELKAICALPFFPRKLRVDALDDFFRYGYIAAPQTIYEDTFEVRPGQWIEFDTRGQSREELYWSAPAQFAQGRERDGVITDEAMALEELGNLLTRSVSEHMLSDVPLGAFLSGGVDSSLIVALAQKISARPVKTFSIGFEQSEYDESAHAEQVARHLGTDHVTEFCSDAQALDIIPRLADIYDQPFWDSSSVPTMLVSQIARKHVTVSLSGDAGDELFGGYNRYFWTLQIARMRAATGPLFPVLSKLLLATPEPTINAAQKILRPLLRGQFARPELGRRIHRVAAIMHAPPWAQFESHLRVCQSHQHPMAPFARPEPRHLRHGFGDDISLPRAMMLHDFCHYLPGDILTKVDRASMAVSLESRIPFLDHRLVEWSFRLDDKLLLRPGRGKLLLRKLLDRHVPRELIERPKSGFGVPIHHWFRGPLEKDFRARLAAARAICSGFLDFDMIERVFAGHQAGVRDQGHQLWAYDTFFRWMERWKPTI
ncbi:asparagine synthase (glutamine-hydrolyzing) [Kamptonema cortianum]|nr:asparagine synthase (glutamine-hydrolyzing) [Oscillatoria laete-virens]MDK3155363.1 asparagine synthase (glutamine-hydrolyzing) [Kamptonema cortianum]MDL5046112.1 asparagine synthase (glutamine-hydrolyzing) [Oscillatoria amoena NRMC-F 0135]MDL5052813.1 asparagine synthase (glutamine-hydrolyzing) [Oscillatoria laete-virens NRMC-F 0139]